MLVAGEVRTWDPQRMHPGPEAFFAQRTFVRTLTGYGTGAHELDLIGDLATTTGTPADAGRTWSFTLRDGVSWQDGAPVTCEDVRRGVARTFEAEGDVRGTNYATFLLDVPTRVTATGLEEPVYTGPADAAGRAAFERAVACSGRTITFHLRTPEPDFPRIVALPEFAPSPAPDSATGAATGSALGPDRVMSTGPYRFSGAWTPGSGGTLVRNEGWDPASDPIRAAHPDTVTVSTGLDEGQVIARLLNGQGDDARAVSWVAASPTLRNQATPALAARMTTPFTGNVDYLALNHRSGVMADPAVRAAFALATNRSTYLAAIGGEPAGEPTWSVLPPVVSDTGLTPPAGQSVDGDPVAARALLERSGRTLPVTVRVVHAESVLGDKAYAALAAGWERAGFDVRLSSLPAPDYYAAISAPAAAAAYDVFRGAWTPDLPSAAAVLPPLFDARTNIDSTGPGQDVGYFDDAAVQALTDRAGATLDTAARADLWLRADRSVRDAGGYVALAATRALHVHGPGVTHYEEHPVGGIVDLATVSVR